MTGILGSGFGLYGYLPAVSFVSKEKIILLKRYKNKYLERDELIQFYDQIEWVDDVNEILNRSSTLILAQTPEQNYITVECILEKYNLKYVLIEKPIAISPEKSKDLIDRLTRSSKTFRVAYTFIYTKWFQELDQILKFDIRFDNIYLKWKFNAHHYKENLSNWKRNHNYGGGVIRFYGIHIIAILSLWKYNEIVSSEVYASNDLNDLMSWNAVFKNPQNDRLFSLEINSNSVVEEFEILISDASETAPLYIFKTTDPFSCCDRPFPNLDIRIALLSNLYKSLFYDSDIDYINWYNSTNELWEKIEKYSLFRKNE
jgi:hypothetical protein